MGAQAGKDLLLKLDTDGLGSFASVAGLRARRIAFNAAAVDVTDSGSAGRWRELLADAGVRSASLSGTGIFRDAASDASVRQVFFDGVIRNWQVVIPDFGIIQGPFQIVSLEYNGDHNAEIAFDLALESAGEMTFVAE
jgi:TP901-1 family phage major tail protein